MREGDRGRVKRKAMQRVRRAVMTIDRAGAVLHVTDERMIDVTQMAANLMKPTRLRTSLDERAAIDG